MGRLKIFSTSKNDWAGCGHFLSGAINQETDHHSRAARKEPSDLGFPYDLQGLTGQRFKVLHRWADVIHIHDAPGWNMRVVASKPTVVTYHGTRYRRGWKSYHEQIVNRGWIGTVSTPDLTRFGLPLLPDVRPDLSDRVTDKHDTFTVCHAPTKRDVKGTRAVIAACERLGVKLDLIENEPWSECIERKSRCHLLIDQFVLGYGCNAIEAWAMELPVIADGNHDALKAITNQFDYLPFCLPEPSLEDAIARMRDDEIWAQDWADTGRAHYFEYHSPWKGAERAVSFYERAIAAHKNVKKRRYGALPLGSNIVLMRYVGESAGKQTWFPDGTKQKYLFGSGDERYVYEADAEWFLQQKTARGKPLFEVAE